MSYIRLLASFRVQTGCSHPNAKAKAACFADSHRVLVVVDWLLALGKQLVNLREVSLVLYSVAINAQVFARSFN